MGYAHQNGLCAPDLSPNDDEFLNGNQWNLDNPYTQGADIHALDAWDIYTGNQNNIIAIIDGGVDNHRDLNDKISGGDSGWGWGGHGTHVAGIAAAETNNDQDIAGVDWNARIHSQRIDGLDDAGTYQAIIAAVNFSANVKVLNNSYDLVTIYEGDTIPGRYSFTVGLAAAYAIKANRTFVAGMGNSEEDYPGVICFPAAYENVISVGASDWEDHIPDYSQTGSHIDVVAPGDFILSTLPNNTLGFGWGTSFATPHVSGLASLLVGYNSNLSVNDIANIIRLSADDINYPEDPQIGPGFDVKSGFGRINAANALNLLRAPNSIHQWSATTGTDYSTSNYYLMQFIGVPGLASGNYLVKKHEVRKNVTFAGSFCTIRGCWGRATTNGFSLASPNYGMGFCEIVPGTLTNTGATLRTYVYQVYTTTGQYLGYYPTTPSNVTFAYTILGILNPTISGPFLVCSTDTTFNLDNLPGGSTVTWNKSSNITIVSSTSTSCTVVANGIGNGWVEANITGICNPITLRKDVWVGTFESTYVTGQAAVCPDSYYTYTAQVPGGHSPTYSYSWTYPSNWYNYGQYQNTISLVTPMYNPDGGTVRVSITNDCGTSGYSGITVYPDYNCGGYFSLYPNPASEIIIITNKKSSELKTKVEDLNKTYTIRILDIYSNLHFSGIRSGDTFTIPINNLTDGNYIVQISDGKNIFNLKLVIKH
ncbi:MAG: S8 family peptidase [Bacteroidales bacterium]|nr:S8 family peptidase [Bacteroidales bacterium]